MGTPSVPQVSCLGHQVQTVGFHHDGVLVNGLPDDHLSPQSSLIVPGLAHVLYHGVSISKVNVLQPQTFENLSKPSDQGPEKSSVLGQLSSPL